MLECEEGQLSGEKLSKGQEMSAVRWREKREVDRLDGVSDKRILGEVGGTEEIDREAGWTGQ